LLVLSWQLEFANQHAAGNGEQSGEEGTVVIRQAISCDLCGNEKRQTNHWFVAYEQNGELRLAGWNSRNRLRAGTRHLCGQTCLHKLVDDFMARAIQQKSQPPTEAGAKSNAGTAGRAIVQASAVTTGSRPSTGIDSGLTSISAYEGVESSARLIKPSISALESAASKPAALVAMSGRKWIDSAVPPIEEPRPTARNRRIEAWERERERELHLQDCRGEMPRRRSGSR
jgi:hypothetical protein